MERNGGRPFFLSAPVTPRCACRLRPPHHYDCHFLHADVGHRAPASSLHPRPPSFSTPTWAIACSLTHPPAASRPAPSPGGDLRHATPLPWRQELPPLPEQLRRVRGIGRRVPLHTGPDVWDGVHRRGGYPQLCRRRASREATSEPHGPFSLRVCRRYLRDQPVRHQPVCAFQHALRRPVG
jgi:hypothetical protein